MNRVTCSAVKGKNEATHAGDCVNRCLKVSTVPSSFHDLSSMPTQRSPS